MRNTRQISLHYKTKIIRLWLVVKIFRVSMNSTRRKVFLMGFPSLISASRMVSFILSLKDGSNPERNLSHLFIPFAAIGREVGGSMLAITGGINLWYVSNVTNMRYGKYRLFAENPCLIWNVKLFWKLSRI